MGLATYPHDAKTPHDVIRQADEMMYMVKNSTRDNIGIAQRGDREVEHLSGRGKKGKTTSVVPHGSA